MRFFTPYPFHGHRGLGNGLDTSSNLGPAQRVSAVPGGVILATHVANLVNSVLKGENSAANESPQQVICHHPFSLERDNEVVDAVDLEDGFPGIETPVVLFRGRATYKCRQIQEVSVGWALHVEEGPLPFSA